MLQTYSNYPYHKNSKILQRLPKNHGNQTKDTATAAKPKVKTTTKNNDRGINDHNTTRETELH